MVSPEGDPLDRGVLTVRSWDEIVRTHSARVYHLSYRLTGNPHDAADLTQDVFVQLFRSFPQPAKGSLETWLRRVTTNRFFDQLWRKQRLRFETLADHASERTPSLEPTPSQVFNDQTVDDDMRTALDALSPGVRAAVLLCDIEGLTHSEVAATLGIGINTARTRICRGRAQLQDALTDRAPQHPWPGTRYDARGLHGRDCSLFGPP
jgi:RNA polymerase sigma factor (sigma-70 family)